MTKLYSTTGMCTVQPVNVSNVRDGPRAEQVGGSRYEIEVLIHIQSVSTDSTWDGTVVHNLGHPPRAILKQLLPCIRWPLLPLEVRLNLALAFL